MVGDAVIKVSVVNSASKCGVDSDVEVVICQRIVLSWLKLFQ